jgi:hypothetical protein
LGGKYLKRDEIKEDNSEERGEIKGYWKVQVPE